MKEEATLDKLNITKDSIIELKLRLKGGTREVYNFISEKDEIFKIYEESDSRYAFTEKWVETNKENLYTLIFDDITKPSPGNGVAGFVIKDNGTTL